MRDRTRAVGKRLSYAVPLSIWPIFFWVSSLPHIPSGRHQLPALLVVSSQLGWALLTTLAVGLVLAIAYRDDRGSFLEWIAFALVHSLVFVFAYPPYAVT